MEPAENVVTLSQLPVGARLLYRTRTEWRNAVISRKNGGSIVLSVASPHGRNYRLRRDPEMRVIFDTNLYLIETSGNEKWIENFGRYDCRW